MELPLYSALVLFLCLLVFILQYLFRDKKTISIKVALAILVCLSLFGYLRFGKPHMYGDQTRLVHRHDGYHYFMGAKYYRQIGHTQLYKCTYTAFKELESKNIKVPKIRSIRSLEDISKSTKVGGDTDAQLFTECKARFTKERWDAFKSDVLVFLTLPWEDIDWQNLLRDAGNNSPPSWVLITGVIAEIFPLTPRTLDLIAVFDLILVIILLPILIYRSFGLYAAMTFLIIFGNNWLHHFGWTGGSFFRHLWLFFLGVGLCTLHRKKCFLSGVFLGASTALRLFPAFFVAGAVINLTVRMWREDRKTSRRDLFLFVFGVVCTISLLFGFSVMTSGFSAWKEFYADISQHSEVGFVNHIGYHKHALYYSFLGNQHFGYGGRILHPTLFLECIKDVYNSQIWFHYLARIVGVIAALLVSVRASKLAATMVFGTVMMFFFTMPAGYYYSLLALFPAVFLSDYKERANVIRLFGCLIFAALFSLFQFLTLDDRVFNVLVNLLMFLFVQLLLGSYLLEFGLSNCSILKVKSNLRPMYLKKILCISSISLTLCIISLTTFSILRSRWRSGVAHNTTVCLEWEKKEREAASSKEAFFKPQMDKNGVPFNNRRT